VWDSATLAERLPYLDRGCYFPPKSIADEGFWAGPAGQVSAYWMPDCGFVDDPAFAAQNLMAAACRLGAQVHFRAPVTGVLGAERVAGVRLSDGTTLSAPIVVNAAGPHSGAVNALAGVGADFSVTTKPMRQEVHEVRGPAGFNDAGPGPFMADFDLGNYMRGTPSGGLLVGGMEPECDPMQWLTDPDDYNVKATKSVFDAQVYRAARRFPGLAVPDSPRGVAGVYDVSDDWIPIYDKTDRAGYYVAIGTSGNQFKNAPVIGQFLAAIIESCENGGDHDVEPVVVTLPRTGHTIDLSHYSRRRPVNTDRSYNVMG
jgi:sarcosine oxidase subunit beta